MKLDKSKGQKLHDSLTNCLRNNLLGYPYTDCSRACSEQIFWVKDAQCNCFSAKKVSGAFKIEHLKSTQGGVCWLVCVDEGIITNKKSMQAKGECIPRCDSLVFNDEFFYYIEAKMNVKSNNWVDELQDAIKNKIPATKSILLTALSTLGYSISHKICIAVNFPKSNNRIPKSISQKQETLRRDAEKALNQKVEKLVLSDTIPL